MKAKKERELVLGMLRELLLKAPRSCGARLVSQVAVAAGYEVVALNVAAVAVQIRKMKRAGMPAVHGGV